MSDDIAVANDLVQRMVGGRFDGCFVWMDVKLYVQRDKSADVITAADFTLFGPDGDHVVNVAEDPASAARLLALLRSAHVDSIEVTMSGDLTVKFDTGHSFTLTSDPDYEGWQVSGDDGLLIVAVPGGDVAVWEPGGGNVARGGKGSIWQAGS